MMNIVITVWKLLLINFLVRTIWGEYFIFNLKERRNQGRDILKAHLRINSMTNVAVRI